jgi:hypothetical protein
MLWIGPALIFTGACFAAVRRERHRIHEIEEDR